MNLLRSHADLVLTVNVPPEQVVRKLDEVTLAKWFLPRRRYFIDRTRFFIDPDYQFLGSVKGRSLDLRLASDYMERGASFSGSIENVKGQTRLNITVKLSSFHHVVLLIAFVALLIFSGELGVWITLGVGIAMFVGNQFYNEYLLDLAKRDVREALEEVLCPSGARTEVEDHDGG